MTADQLNSILAAIADVQKDLVIVGMLAIYVLSWGLGFIAGLKR